MMPTQVPIHLPAGAQYDKIPALWSVQKFYSLLHQDHVFIRTLIHVDQVHTAHFTSIAGRDTRLNCVANRLLVRK